MGDGRVVSASSGDEQSSAIDLGSDRTIAWLRTSISGSEALSAEISPDEIAGAALRMSRFAPLLKAKFSGDGWDGHVRSDLIELESERLWLKADHALPMTGSIKARGGVHEVLAYVEQVALDHGLINGGSYAALGSAHARAIFARHTVVVASTGNLGYSVGLVARAFGVAAEVHMSHEAKGWKKARLRAIGAIVVEHRGDYSQTVAGARLAASEKPRRYFVDDENSRRLFTGYAVAAGELAAQLAERDIAITADRPLVVYLPCGVGGAPGGITFGLKTIFGRDVICVFVEPVQSACMLLAMATGGGQTPSCYAFGGTNQTIADGLAVPMASALVVSTVGDAIDAVVAVVDEDLLDFVRSAWREYGLRLEPAAAAAFAGRRSMGRLKSGAWAVPQNAVEVVWATGGSQLPDAEFLTLLDS